MEYRYHTFSVVMHVDLLCEGSWVDAFEEGFYFFVIEEGTYSIVGLFLFISKSILLGLYFSPPTKKVAGVSFSTKVSSIYVYFSTWASMSAKS